MQYFTLFPMNGYWGKYLGAFMCALALAGLVLIITGDLRLLSEPVGLPGMALLFAAGLFIITFSKERIDDERVMRIRYTSFRCTLMLSYLASFSVFFPFILSANEGPLVLGSKDVAIAITFLMIAPLLVYQVIFQIGLRLDPEWVYTDATAEENFRKTSPKLFWFITILIALEMLILIFLFLFK